MTDPCLSPGARLRAAGEAEQPLQVVGVINAYCAMLAGQAGFRALYLSGAGVANASLGLPDLGLTTLNDVCEDIRRITRASGLPLLVDADTGWGGVRLALYPLSAFRAMSQAAAKIYQTVRTQGTQSGVTDLMQSRADLYDVLGYHACEQKLDDLFSKSEPNP